MLIFTNRNETTAITITAPTIDGIIAIPANEGPQLPRSDCPTDEPIRPAKIFAINPIEPPFFSDCTCDETNKTSNNNGPQI